MSWSCTRHEHDEGSRSWNEQVTRIVARANERHMRNANAICPACYDASRTTQTILRTLVQVMARLLDEDTLHERDRDRVRELRAVLDARIRGPAATALAARDATADALEPVRRAIVANLERADLATIAPRWAERLATTHRTALGIEDDDPQAAALRWAIAARIDGREPAPHAYPTTRATQALWELARKGDHEAVHAVVAITRERGTFAKALDALAEATAGDPRRPTTKLSVIVMCTDVTSEHQLIMNVDAQVLARDRSLADAVRTLAHKRRGEAAVLHALCERWFPDEVDQAALALAGTLRWDGEGYRQTGLVIVDENGHGLDERIRHLLGPGRQPVPQHVEQARAIVREQVKRWLVGDQDGIGALVAAMDRAEA